MTRASMTGTDSDWRERTVTGVKIREMIANQPVWRGLMGQKMPAKVAYALAKNVRKIETELALYNETRLKLLAENWPKSEDGSRFEIPSEDEAKWEVMLNDLVDVEVDLDAHMVDFGAFDSVDLTPAEVLALEFMILQD